MKYRPKHVLEYAALRLVAAVFSFLPYRLALALGWCLAWLSFRVLRSPVREAKSRISAVFGSRLAAGRVSRIAWTSWRNTVFNAVEILRLPRITAAWVATHCAYEPTMQMLTGHAASGQGGIIAVPHMGNWELAGVACHLRGLPIFNIAGRQRNPLVNRYLNELRASPGIETLERGGTSMRRVIRNIREGQFLAILPDSRVREPGIVVPLLGGEANLGKGMALFARHADVPIFPCILTRSGWARHQARHFPPIRPDKTLDKEADVARMTGSVIAIVERAIREEPEQWFWFNRRWVLDPLEDDAGTTP